jgi:hypothetical protein
MRVWRVLIPEETTPTASQKWAESCINNIQYTCGKNTFLQRTALCNAGKNFSHCRDERYALEVGGISLTRRALKKIVIQMIKVPSFFISVKIAASLQGAGNVSVAPSSFRWKRYRLCLRTTHSDLSRVGPGPVLSKNSYPLGVASLGLSCTLHTSTDLHCTPSCYDFSIKKSQC